MYPAFLLVYIFPTRRAMKILLALGATTSRVLVSSPCNCRTVAACGGRYVFRNDSTRGVFERVPVT